MQTSFSELAYAAKKITRRDRFLGEIDAATPWSALVEPFYPKGCGQGQPPMGVERWLRMSIAQQCFGWFDKGIKDAIDESQSIRGFVGIDFTRQSASEATTLLKFHRLRKKQADRAYSHRHRHPAGGQGPDPQGRHGGRSD